MSDPFAELASTNPGYAQGDCGREYKGRYKPAGRGANWANTGCMDGTNCDRAYALSVWFNALMLVT